MKTPEQLFQLAINITNKLESLCDVISKDVRKKRLHETIELIRELEIGTYTATQCCVTSDAYIYLTDTVGLLYGMFNKVSEVVGYEVANRLLPPELWYKAARWSGDNYYFMWN